MTVLELQALCEQEIAKGNGAKEIVLCMDDEFAPLEHGFSLPAVNGEEVFKLLDAYEAEEDSVLVLN